LLLFLLFVEGLLSAPGAVFLQLELLGVAAGAPARPVVPPGTVRTFHEYPFAPALFRHGSSPVSIAGHSMILVTTPWPTVLPPSRMAKRSFSSIAIGVPRSTTTWRLSPGMTISTPSGSVHWPVTSVVRK